MSKIFRWVAVLGIFVCANFGVARAEFSIYLNINDNGATTSSEYSGLYYNDDDATCETDRYYDGISCKFPMVTEFNAPTKTGFKYLGHYTLQTGGRLWAEPIANGKARILQGYGPGGSNPTVYAHWRPIKITLNHQSATTNGAPSTLYLKGGTGGGWYRDEAMSQPITSLDTVPTRNGYMFVGYYTRAGGGGTQIISSNGSLLTNSNVLNAFTDDSTIYAFWVQNYTITLNPNGGTPTSNQSIWARGVNFYSDSQGNNRITASVFSPISSGGAGLSTLTYTGHAFAGYYSAASGGTQMIDSSGNIVTTNSITSSQTWYARWTTVVTCADNDIYLSANGGTIPSGCQTTLHPVANSTYSSGFATPAITNASNCIPTKTNYEFLGYWYDGTSTQYYTNTLGIYTTEWGLCSQGNVTLTAHWTGACNLITFDDNNANNTNVNVNNTQRKRTGDTAWLDVDPYNSAQCGKPLTTNPTAVVPTNANATFLGYYTTRDTGGTQIFDGTGATTTYANNTWTISTDTTLYARWQCDTGYTWNAETHACDADKRYELYFKCSLGDEFSEQLASLIYGESVNVEDVFLNDLLEKFCPDACGANASLQGWNVYLNTPGTLSNDSPITNFPHTVTGGVTYGEATPITLVPNCVENPYNSVTYKCYSGDSGQVDTQVTQTGYATRPLSWYDSCNINHDDFSGWLFSGNNSVYQENALISPWTYGDNQTFVPAYDATFSCAASQYWTGDVNQHTTLALGETIATPAMTCTPKPEYVGWVNLDGKWHTSYDHNMATPVPNATCNTGAFTVDGNGTFNWGCPTDLVFLPDDELITKTVTVSCGAGGASTTFEMTYENQGTIEQNIVNWYATTCTGACPLTNPSGYPQGYNRKIVCAMDWGNQTLPTDWEQIENDPQGRICYKTGANVSVQDVFDNIDVAQITDLNISSVSYCPQYVKYKCSADTTDVYDQPPYGVFEREYTTLSHTTIGCDGGYQFINWKNLDDNQTFDENETVNEWPYEAEVTLVAQWGGENTYHIYYMNMENATPSSTGMPTTYTYGVGATINGVPTRPLSEFLGWCTDAALTNCEMTQTISTTDFGDKTFWAKWDCVSPYHPDPNDPSVCVACEDNTWWNPTTQTCDGCSSQFPYSRAPYNWSENQCYRPCQDESLCESNIGSMLDGIPSGCYVEQFPSGITTQIEFKGNYDAGIQTCGGAVPNCPWGFTTCGLGAAYKPMVAPVDFHGKIPEQNLGTRYIFGSRAGSGSIDLIRGDAWSQIAGPGQQTDIIHNNVGGVMMDYRYTHILYPTNAAPDAEVPGYTFNGYYYPRTGGTQYVGNNYLLNATNALSVLGSQPGDSNTSRHLYATLENGGYTQNEYTITYHCGTATGGTAPATQTGIHYGDSVTPRANTCEKPGYNFLGWMVSNTADIKQPGAAFTWQYEESKVFTAKWSDEPIDYTITYHCGTSTGGTAPAPQTGIHYGDSVTPRANTCEKPGYTFLGWAVSNTADIKQPGTAFTWQYEESKVFTAHWNDDPNDYIITYRPNFDGAAQANVIQSVTYGQSFTTADRIFNRPGHIMTGWSEPFPLLNNLYPSYNIDGNTTLDAQWQVCPSGQTPNAAGTACEPCPEGQYSVNGICMPCPDGTQPNATGDACEPCPDGEYGLGGVCNPCPPGTQPNSAHTACEPCPEGQYSVNGICMPCPDGTQPNATGDACEPCPDGEYGLGGVCNPCPPGTQPNTNHTACEPCPDGQYSVNGICMPCPDGTQPNATGDACEPCPDGQYSVNGVCEPCPEGTQPNAAGNACEPCPTGTYWIDGACEPCPEGYSSNPGAIGIDQCFISECPVGQHIEHGECQDDVMECAAPHAAYATRTWNPAMGAYGSCQIQECINGYHITSNACVLDEELCTVPNGRGEREWNGTAWGDCVITQCDPGFENTGTACNECANRRANGEIAVSSYAFECEIATCMYHGQKYILENNECRPICEDAEDETGTKHWDGTKCVHTCNPGYKMW